MAEKPEGAQEMEHRSDVERGFHDEKGFDLAPGEAARLAGLRTVELGLSADQVVTTLDAAQQARILRKVDIRLVPLLSFLYLWVFGVPVF